jgi:hypothetical protein
MAGSPDACGKEGCQPGLRRKQGPISLISPGVRPPLSLKHGPCLTSPVDPVLKEFIPVVRPGDPIKPFRVKIFIIS